MSSTRNTVKITAVFLLVVTSLVFGLSACGGSTTPPPAPPEGSGVISISGGIVLPVGHGIDLSALTIHTPIGTYAVSATGEFEAEVFGGAAAEIGVQTTNGDLLLLGVTQDEHVDLSLSSTAEALLYYAIGGMWLPDEQQDTVRSLLKGVPESDTLEAQLRRQLLAGGNGLAAPDQALLDALQSVHASLIGDAQVTAVAPSAGAPLGANATEESTSATSADAPTIKPASGDASNIIIEPSETIQAGVRVIHNPAGSGVVAQNQFRRPAALLVYETGWEDADKILTENEPPVPIDTIDVPATGQLEFFNALLDVVTADSPWSPVMSPAVNLPSHEGATRTYYQLVLIGPSASDAILPIMTDPRFDIFHGHWEDVEFEKTKALFLDELLLPLIEVYGLGGMAKFDAGKLGELRSRMRLIYDQHLVGLGVFLKNRQAGYVNGLKHVLSELVENRNLRIDMLDMIGDAMIESDYNKFVLESAEKRLKSRASASAIGAAVEAILVGGDVAKIIYDLSSAPAVVAWEAIAMPAFFALSPDVGIVTKENGSVRFSVRQKSPQPGTYLYRWTTSGAHGEISDLLNDGASLDTTADEIWYFHDDPANIEDSDSDTIKVEVFEVEEGATTIPAGATPIARMAAVVEGRDWEIDARIELNFGLTSPIGIIDGKRYPCAEMYLRFDVAPNAKSYLVSVSGVGGQGDERNQNQDFRLGGPNHSAFIDPNARIVGPNVEAGYAPIWDGPCTWLTDDGQTQTSQPIRFSGWRDLEEDQLLVHLFTNVNHSAVPINLSERVELWHEWLDGATFEVKANY